MSRLVVAALALAALAGTAAADDGFIGYKRVALAIDDCAPAPDLDEKALRQTADEHYLRGAVLYGQGDYEGAVAEFVQSYCLVPHWRVLKDMGQAHERMVDYERAVAYYERFVLAVPARVTELDAERRNIAARVQVLLRLRSVVKVATEPPGATVVIASEAGPQASGRDERELTVTAGSYRLRVEKPGYEPIEREITVGIGRPYSFSFRLTPQRGRLRVQAVPGDAKIFVDGRLAGLGAFDGEVTLGVHTLQLEAPGRLPREESVEVRGGSPTSVSLELAAPRQRGRRQMIIATGVVGTMLGVAGGASVDEEGDAALLGAIAGAAVGSLGGNYLVPDDLALGQSSFIITSTLVGFAEGLLVGLLIDGGKSDADGNSDAARSAGAGAVVGATLAATGAVLTAPALDPSPGDAAVFNSGAVWGGVSGLLFTAIFSGSSRVETSMTLSGLTLGTLAGGVLASRYELSRKRVVYLDLCGLAGLTVGAAAASAASAAGDDSSESTAHFTLAGLLVGLGAGVWLTRNMDAPRLPALAPQLTPGKDPAGGASWMFSVGGSL